MCDEPKFPPDSEGTSRAKRLGGAYSLNDVWSVPFRGFDGAVMAGIYGTSPQEYDAMIAYEMRMEAAANPRLFRRKFGSRRNKPRLPRK